MGRGTPARQSTGLVDVYEETGREWSGQAGLARRLAEGSQPEREQRARSRGEQVSRHLIAVNESSDAARNKSSKRTSRTGGYTDIRGWVLRRERMHG